MCFSEKISLGIFWELSAKMTHMKCQALFAQKNTEKIQVSSATVVISSFRVKMQCAKYLDNYLS